MGALSALPALDVKPVQQPDILEKYGQLQQLRGIAQQQAEAPLRMQALQQQVQSGGLDVEQKRREMDSQNSIMQAYTDSNGDLGKTYEAAAKSGKALPSDLIKLRQADLQTKTTALNLYKEQGAVAVQQSEMFSDAANSVKDAPPEARPAVYQQKLTELQKAGVDISKAPPQYPGDQQFEVMRLGLQSHKNALDEAAKQAQVDAQKETARHNQATEDQAAATLANTTANDTAQRKQEGQRISIEGARLNFEKKKFQAESGTGDGADLTDAIGSGKIAPERMAYLLAKNPSLLSSVMQKYPDFDSSKVAAYPQVYRDFTSTKKGTAGGQLNAGSTALKHLAELKAMNTPESHIPGTPAYNAYMNKADTVSSELATFYGDPTIPAIASIKKTLTATLPGNRDAAIGTQAQSMGDKFDSFQQQWENAAPSKSYEAPMPGIDDKAKAARATLDPRYKAQGGGQAASGVNVTAPNGKVYSFKDKQSADTFKKNAGIQ